MDTVVQLYTMIMGGLLASTHTRFKDKLWLRVTVIMGGGGIVGYGICGLIGTIP